MKKASRKLVRVLPAVPPLTVHSHRSSPVSLTHTVTSPSNITIIHSLFKLAIGMELLNSVTYISKFYFSVHATAADRFMHNLSAAQRSIFKISYFSKPIVQPITFVSRRVGLKARTAEMRVKYGLVSVFRSSSSNVAIRFFIPSPKDSLS